MARNSNAGGGGAPIPSLQVVDGGLYIPKRALDRFSVQVVGNALTHMVVVGDSIPQETGIPGVNPGYLDGFPIRLARALGNSFGGDMGRGIFGLWRSGNSLGYANSIQEWTFAGTLPTIASNISPLSLMPYQGVWQIPAGAANVATFTPPPKVAPLYTADCVTTLGSANITATAGFGLNKVGQTIYGLNIPRNSCIVDFTDATHATMSLPATGSGTGVLGLMGRNIAGVINAVGIYWVDSATGGTWSYSLDNGATWNDVASTTPAVATLKRVNVVTTLPNGTIQIRGASAAGVAHNVFLAGVELRSSAATPTQGVMTHNLTKDGATWNNIDNGGNTRGLLGAGANQDYLRILDNKGDPTQASLQPGLVIVCISNDCDLIHNGTITLAQHQANVQAFIDRLFPSVDILVVNPMEQSRIGGATAAEQAAMRAATTATCLANGVAVLDVFDAWAAQGTAGFAACNADGLMINPIHPSLEGHADMAGHIMRALAIAAV